MFPILRFPLTICKLALLEHLTESLTEFQVALALGTFDELFQLVGTGLLLLRVLLVHGLSLVRLLKKLEHNHIKQLLETWKYRSVFFVNLFINFKSKRGH